jgi:hypothetical protein
MGSLRTNEPSSGEAGGTNGHTAVASPKASGPKKWRFDTLQVHAGLEESPVYGQCTLPVYSSVSFKFDSSVVAERAFSINDRYSYSRYHNVSVLLLADIEEVAGRRLMLINMDIAQQ